MGELGETLRPDRSAGHPPWRRPGLLARHDPLPVEVDVLPARPQHLAPTHPGCGEQLEDGDRILDTWLAAHAEGVACVIGDPTFQAAPRVRSLTPDLVKVLKFDLVLLIDPKAFGTGIEAAVDRYVAMTRATQQLVILTSS